MVKFGNKSSDLFGEYEGEKSNLVGRNLLFDYRGKTYPVYGFLPNRYTISTDSSYDNAFYDPELQEIKPEF